MSQQTSVVLLQEYCQKKGAPPPHYTISDFKNQLNLFTCVVRAFDQEADGTGTSRSIAKHDASFNILKKLQALHNDLKGTNVLHQPITSDYLMELVNFCMENKHPYPAAEITNQSGPPHVPVFTALVRVGSIAAEEVAASKSAAKQLAAKKVLNIVKNLTINNNLTESVVDFEKQTADRKNIIKEYRRIVNYSSTDMSLQNRHNYFKDMNPDIKEAAFKIIDDFTITSSKTRAELLLRTLGIRYKISSLHNKRGWFMPFIELDCDLDVVFANTYDKIFCDIIDYFRDML